MYQLCNQTYLVLMNVRCVYHAETGLGRNCYYISMYDLLRGVQVMY